MNEPRDLIQHLEKNPQLPKGDGEILSVYGVESRPFASGDILCSRHVLASSFGPAYTAIWHRDPNGDWHFYQDVPPRQGCARFFGLQTSLCCRSRPTGTDHGACASLRRAGLSGSSISVRRSLTVR